MKVEHCRRDRRRKYDIYGNMEKLLRKIYEVGKLMKFLKDIWEYHEDDSSE